VTTWTHDLRQVIDRVRGALVGLAVGDAVGTAVEFMEPGSFEPVTDMVGGGPFKLAPGQWTDDTSLALCLAESLIECGRFDPSDQMDRYVRWYREGYLSSTGRCFDIGITTSAALQEFERSGDPYSGSTSEFRAGNGSVMRLAPIPIFFSTHAGDAVFYSAESSRTTHGAPQSVDGCRYFGGLLFSATAGVEKEELLAPRHTPAGLWDDHAPWHPAIQEVASGSFKSKSPPEINGSGYVVDTIEAALWAFHETDTFEEGLLKVVNLGDDADTTGAVFGQLAGCYYGTDGIPSAWVQRLTMIDKIEAFADQLESGARTRNHEADGIG
jgi:ADP-ribosyl-[dinitrogen reductase] hydrolase